MQDTSIHKNTETYRQQTEIDPEPRVSEWPQLHSFAHFIVGEERKQVGVP